MDFQPQEEGVRQVLTLLNLSMAPSTAAQRTVHEEFEKMSKNPELCKYLMFVVSKLPNEDEAVRSRSCLNVKNIIKNYSDFDKDVLEYVKRNSLEAIADESHLVRNTVSTLISSIVALFNLSSWPELLPTLLALLDTNDMNACEGAMNTFQRICEDSQELSRPESPLNHFIVKFINSLSHENSKIRSCSASCINMFIQSSSPAFTDNLDYFMNMFFQLTADNDIEVCKQICRAFIMLVEQKSDHLAPHMKRIIEYMILKTQDENIALDACEIWHLISDQNVFKEALKPFLPKLIPILVNNMKFTDMDIVLLKVDAEDDCILDRDEDIKPRFCRLRSQADDDSSDDEEELTSSWNLRKSSAAALDTIAYVYKEEILPTILPILNNTLFHEDWVVKESGILALGAISEGCIIGICYHLNQLVPYLIECLSHQRSLIRVITCWTLSRYYSWIVLDQNSFYIDQILPMLLQKMLDKNKKVQESACSALAKLEEMASSKLYLHLESILNTFALAHSKYQKKNLNLLYDATGTLANHVGPYLNTPDFIRILMPPLIEKWNKTNDDDKGLFCLFECISCVAIAIKSGITPFVEPIYKRCLNLIELTLAQQVVAQQASETEHKNDIPEPDLEFVVSALELISGLLGSINELMEPLVHSIGEGNSNLIPLLFQCMQNSFPEVRQSCFSVLGDLARNCFSCIYPALGAYFPIIIQNMDPSYLTVCNNATWAIGEICLKLTHNDLSPYIHQIIEQLILIIGNGKKVLTENAAIALGRLGNVCPAEVSTVIDKFSELWCYSVVNIRDKYEKETTFNGMCKIISENPSGLVNNLKMFCLVIGTWDNPGEDVKIEMSKILQGYMHILGRENWEKVICAFSEPVRLTLSTYLI